MNQFTPPNEPIESVHDRMIDAVTANQQGVLDSVDSAGHAVFDGMRRTQDEVTAFVAERIRQDLDTQNALLRCRNLDEIRDVQARFFRTAVKQYSGEAMQLFGIGRQMVERSIERATV